MQEGSLASGLAGRLGYGHTKQQAYRGQPFSWCELLQLQARRFFPAAAQMWRQRPPVAEFQACRSRSCVGL
ncbi:hypothetical protein Dimus_026777, partial [Dionaea muscipula]